MRKTLIGLLAAVATALGLALSAVPAGAGVLPTLRLTSIGTAGYEAAVPAAHSVGGTITTYGPALNVGVLGAGGLGEQLCNPNNDFRVVLGEVASGGAFNVDFASGVQGDCRNGGTFPAPQAHLVNSALTGLPVGDPVQVWMHYYDKTFCKSVPDPDHDACVWTEVGRVHIQVFEPMITGEVWDSYITIAPDQTFNSVGAGLQQNLTNVSACFPLDTAATDSGVDLAPPGTEDGGADVGAEEAGYSLPNDVGSGACNLVAQFTNVSVGPANVFATGTPFAVFPVNQVASSPGGLSANPVLAAPLNTLSGFSFEAFAGNPTGA